MVEVFLFFWNYYASVPQQLWHKMSLSNSYWQVKRMDCAWLLMKDLSNFHKIILWWTVENAKFYDSVVESVITENKEMTEDCVYVLDSCMSWIRHAAEFFLSVDLVWMRWWTRGEMSTIIWFQNMQMCPPSNSYALHLPTHTHPTATHWSCHHLSPPTPKYPSLTSKHSHSLTNWYKKFAYFTDKPQ